MQTNEVEIKTIQTTSEEEFIMKPYIDWCFKELMRNPKTRTGFIAALLRLPPEQIGRTTILENELSKRTEEEKQGVLDVRVLLESGTQLDIEMQVLYIEYWDDRSLFYLSKMFSSQLQKGESYDKLQKCIQVGVLNFTYFKKDNFCHRRVRFYDEATGDLYSEKLELQILELPKIPKEYHHPDGIIAWIFRGGNKKEMEEMAKGNAYLESAYEDLMEMSQDEKKRLAYEARERALRDQLALQHQTEKIFQQIAEVQGELDKAKDTLAETKGQLSKTQGQLSKTQGQLSKTQGQLSETQGQLSETQGQLSETRGQLSETRGQLSETQEQLSETQKQLAEAHAQNDVAHDQGRKDAIIDLYQKGLLNLEQAASSYGMSTEDFQKLIF